MNNQFGLKELYEVRLKTTYPIEINGVSFEKNETIAYFDKIQISNIDEVKTWVAAQGGFDNRAHVIWEDTKQVNINFSQGIFSKTQFALLSNARLIEKNNNEPLIISQREELESDENGYITLKYEPYNECFIYSKETKEKITNWGKQDNILQIEKPFQTVIIDYNFNYLKNASIMKLGHRLIEGFLCLEGKTRVKDDITGHVKTGILKIPKLKLMSELSIKLGRNADPIIGNFSTAAFPIGDKGTKKVMEIYFLEDDIDSDI